MNNNLRKIYETLRQRNPNSNEQDLRRQAWVINDRQMFEANTNLAPSSSAVGSGGGVLRTNPDFFTALLTLDLGEGNFGIIRMPLDYIINYTIDTTFSFAYSLNLDYSFLIQWNSVENYWELADSESVVYATSTISPYDGWIPLSPEETGVVSVTTQLNNVCVRNFCFTDSVDNIVNPLEVINSETGSIIFYLLPSGFVTYDSGEDDWYYLYGEGGSILLGGTYNDFPYGTFTDGELEITLTNGFCPL